MFIGFPLSGFVLFCFGETRSFVIFLSLSLQSDFFFLSSLFAYFLGDGLLSNHGLGFGRSVTLML